MKWSDIKKLWRARRDGTPLGDLVVMKFAMYTGKETAINERLGQLGEPACLEVDLAEMRGLPDGTVGREYARHLDDHGLTPLAISAACKRQYADTPLALRYTTTHDLFHTITGFSTHPAGELGLFAFMVGQGFAAGGRSLLRFSRIVYALVYPLHAAGAWHNARVGLALGERAKNLLEAPLASLLRRPLVEVRRELGLPEDPARAGIVPGHASALATWLLPKPQARVAAAV